MSAIDTHHGENRQKVLLESGTNEVEILEFYLGGQSYGINVSKVLQIVAHEERLFTATPAAPPEAPGVYLWRGKTITQVDLRRALNVRSSQEAERPIVLVTEFNSVTNGFFVDGVNRIHRLSWEQLDPASQYLERYSARVVGSVHVDGKDILLPDFEQIVAELSPDTKLGYGDFDLSRPAGKMDRESAKIYIAEDSQFIRANMVKLLAQAGYTDVTQFENGRDALEAISALTRDMGESGRPISEGISLLVTDIEMPQMDGLTLCKRVKNDQRTQGIPVIIFSSLINEQMIVKCQEVGADDHVTKPQMGRLVFMLDRLLHIESN